MNERQECPECRSWFTAKRGNQVYCSASCKRAAFEIRVMPDPHVAPRDEVLLALARYLKRTQW